MIVIYRANLITTQQGVIEAGNDFWELTHKQYQAIAEYVMNMIHIKKLRGKLDKSFLIEIERWVPKKLLGYWFV